MGQKLIYPIGTTPACRYAVKYLDLAGIPLVDHPTPEVTHLLLDVPSFGPDGSLRNGGDLESVLRMLPHDITIAGGNLEHPALEGYRTIDLLKDTYYVSENATITADCALQIAAPLLTTTLQHAPALIIGWGRIGKCLAKTFHAIGNDVTVAARKETDRAMLSALGYTTADTARLTGLWQYRLIFNTVPELVLRKEQLAHCKNCVKIDLASRRGLEGEDVVWARGLPGIHAPETSGELIAQTLIRYLKEE